jgi:hypothetical protein
MSRKPREAVNRKELNPGVALLEGIPSGARVLVEVGRRLNDGSPEWSTPFYDTLYVARYKGVPCGLSLNGYPIAEFDPRHDWAGCYGDCEFHTEDCILRILEINGVKVAESMSGMVSLDADIEAYAAVQAAALIDRMRLR